MKLKYGFFTPKVTKEFLDPINWGLLKDVFSDYINQISPDIQLSFPKSINIGGLQSVIAHLVSKITGEMTGGIYSLSSGNIQINTIEKVKEYALLLAIIHELTHALGFNDNKNRSGYSAGKRFNSFNEGVTQKVAEEVTDEFLSETDVRDKRTMYLTQVAKNLALTILGSDVLSEQTKQAIPSIGRIMETNMDPRKASLEIARELLNYPEMRAAIEQKAEENLTSLDIYTKEVSIVDGLISVLSSYSGKSGQEVWLLIKRGYFEGIDIIELCTHPQYGIQYDEGELMKILL